MLRGVIKFTKDQIADLNKMLDKDKFKGTQLYEKVKSADTQEGSEIPLQLSENEVEILIDEIEPNPTNVIRKILSEAVLSWRSSSLQ